VADADQILQFVERDVAIPVRKCLASAVANAENNDSQDPEALFVSACFADEGPTLKRWRPRARGRATRIRKRTTHVTIIVSRLPEAEIRRRTERETAVQAATGRRPTQSQAASRRARVARSRQQQATTGHEGHDHGPGDPVTESLPADAETAEPDVSAGAGMGEGAGEGLNVEGPVTALDEPLVAEDEVVTEPVVADDAPTPDDASAPEAAVDESTAPPSGPDEDDKNEDED
jgi:large subunit ribosomal protein L22